MCIQTTGRYSLVGNCNPSHRPNRQFTTSAGLSSARPVRRSSRFKHKSVACCHFEVFRGPGGQKPHSQPKLRNGCRLIRPIGCTDLRSFRTLAFAVLEILVTCSKFCAFCRHPSVATFFAVFRKSPDPSAKVVRAGGAIGINEGLINSATS
jgi:hypothetical protein